MQDHPLFPRRDPDDDPTEVSFISVARLERGQWVTAPGMISAEQLEDEQMLFDRFGGGHYELTARSGGQSGRQLITGKSRIILPGEPLPLTGEGPSGPIPQAPQFAPAPPGAGFDANLLIAMMNMQGQQMQAFLGLITTIMTTFMAKGDQSSANLLKAMTEMSSADKANMAAFFQAMTSMKTGGGSGELANFMKGIEFAVQNQAPAPEAEEDVLDTVQEVMKGAAVIGEMMKANGPPPVAPGAVPYTPKPKANAPPSPA